MVRDKDSRSPLAVPGRTSGYAARGSIVSRVATQSSVDPEPLVVAPGVDTRARFVPFRS